MRSRSTLISCERSALDPKRTDMERKKRLEHYIFPLRHDLNVKLSIPNDLTREEAEQVIAFIKLVTRPEQFTILSDDCKAAVLLDDVATIAEGGRVVVTKDEVPVLTCDNCRHKAFLHTASGECMEWQCSCDRCEPEPRPEPLV